MNGFQKHCPGCFHDKSGAAICAVCGYDESEPRPPLFLPHGLIIGGQYRVGRVLGKPGGFGITYLTWDIHLQQRFAIKEYLPRPFATRDLGQVEVRAHGADDQPAFDEGKDEFLREARLVASLDHPGVVRVRNFFRANGTAYLVMDYYEGLSLGDYLAGVRGRLEPAVALKLSCAVLDALDYVHERGVIHRDIKPHNVYLTRDGRPIVLDFGAARRGGTHGHRSASVVVTEGYAPLEQYQRRAPQGPWTDVYSVAALLYRMLAGQPPPMALDRIGEDPLEVADWAGIPAPLKAPLSAALAVKAADRLASARSFRERLEASRETLAAGAEEPPPFRPLAGRALPDRLAARSAQAVDDALTMVLSSPLSVPPPTTDGPLQADPPRAQTPLPPRPVGLLERLSGALEGARQGWRAGRSQSPGP